GKWRQRLIGSGKRKRNRHIKMSLGEIATIIIAFQVSGYRTFKDYYTKHVEKYWKKEFPDLFSYSRMVEVMPSVLTILYALLKCNKGTKTGVYYVDSMNLAV